MATTKVIIFQEKSFSKAYLDEILPKFNQNKIYTQISTTRDAKILSLYLLAISCNEAAASGNKDGMLYYDNLDGSNLINQNSYMVSDFNKSLNSMVGLVIIEGTYAGHAYFNDAEHHRQDLLITGLYGKCDEVSLLLLAAIQNYDAKHINDGKLTVSMLDSGVKRTVKQLGLIKPVKGISTFDRFLSKILSIGTNGTVGDKNKEYICIDNELNYTLEVIE